MLALCCEVLFHSVDASVVRIACCGAGGDGPAVIPVWGFMGHHNGDSRELGQLPEGRCWLAQMPVFSCVMRTPVLLVQGTLTSALILHEKLKLSIDQSLYSIFAERCRPTHLLPEPCGPLC